jgi:hypothetical protein
MKARELTRRAKSRKFPINGLLDELLYMILERLDKQDLLNLGLVPRGIYLRVASVLYKDIELNLRQATHQQLLQRLSHPRTRLPEYIRLLGIFRPDYTDPEQFGMIRTLLTGMRNLRVLKWSDIDIPCNTLDVVTTRFPNAVIKIYTQDGKLTTPQRWDNARPEAYPLFAHPASLRITRFEFAPTSRYELHPHFKLDVVKTLKRSKHLVTFKLHIWENMFFNFPEYAEQFRTGELPKLENFTLRVQHRLFFTARELVLWGDRGGWENLTTLVLCFTNLFEVFVGRALNLEELYLTLSERGDLHKLKLEHETTVIKRPFTKLHHFTFATPEIFERRYEDELPLDILKWMPNVKSLNLFHQAPGLLRLRQEIREINRLIPDLEKLSLGVFSPATFPPFRPHNPFDIGALEALACLANLLTLDFYVPRRYGRKKLLGSMIDHYHVSRYIRKERQRLELTWTQPFKIGLKHVYPHEDLRFDPNVPTKWAINYDTPLGAITVLRDSVSTRQRIRDMVSSDDFLGIMSPDEMLLSTLLEMRTKYIIGDITCRRGKYAKEIKRRVRDMKASIADTEFPTLYDAWTQQDDATVE